jgi:hypothetical protein
MTQLTKFADLIKNATTQERGKILDDIKAAAASGNMPLADLKALSAALDAEVKARQAKTTLKAKRLERLAAAMADQSNDAQIDSAVALVRAGLRSLGFGDINAHGEKGIDANELHQKAKAAGWDGVRITQLKAAAAAIGICE